MGPRIFVSSTIRDLLHVRDAIRELVVELGYLPVMSEHGEIGFLPDQSAAQSCYHESKDCDLGVLIVGKRYGDEDRNGLSVTENEFRSLYGEKVPLVTLIEKDVLAFKALFDANNQRELVTFPGMDHPARTFSFISSVMNSEFNNGVAEFSHIGEARDYIRKQLAHLFGHLLRQRTDSIRTDLKDVLAAMHSLRKDFLRVHQDPNSNRFLRASRFLLDDSAKQYRGFLERAFGGFEEAVSKILAYETYAELLKGANFNMQVQAGHVAEFATEEARRRVAFGSHWSGEWEGKSRWMGYYCLQDKTVIMDPEVVDVFEGVHGRIRRESGM